MNQWIIHESSLILPWIFFHQFPCPGLTLISGTSKWRALEKDLGIAAPLATSNDRFQLSGWHWIIYSYTLTTIFMHWFAYQRLTQEWNNIQLPVRFDWLVGWLMFVGWLAETTTGKIYTKVWEDHSILGGTSCWLGTTNSAGDCQPQRESPTMVGAHFN